jgi:hypothetical protein
MTILTHSIIHYFHIVKTRNRKMSKRERNQGKDLEKKSEKKPQPAMKKKI